MQTTGESDIFVTQQKSADAGNVGKERPEKERETQDLERRTRGREAIMSHDKEADNGKPICYMGIILNLDREWRSMELIPGIRESSHYKRVGIA